MQKWTFLKLAKHILQEGKRPLSAKEIWDIAKNKGYDKYIETRGKTPWATIGAQIYVNIRDNKSSPFIKVSSRPQKFALRDWTKTGLVEISESVVSQYEEKELHPFLAYFAFNNLKAYTKTIQHSKSSKKEFGEWVHPDMVGLSFPIKEWKSEVIDFGSIISNIPIKLLSFEIKTELDFSNLREAFFQTVSNSSWANEAYLVASAINETESFLNELRRLSASFGIGVIKLDVNEPDSSKIIFPAKYKEYLDWETINKLASMNEDFSKFLKRIKNDITNKEIISEKYDPIYDKDTLIKLLKK